MIKLDNKLCGKNNFVLSSVFVFFFVVSLGVQADIRKLDLNIKDQNIGSALVELGESVGVQILFKGDEDNQIQLSGISGKYTLNEALDKLLSNSGFVYQFTSENTVVVKKGASGAKGSKSEDEGYLVNQELEEIIITAEKREQNVQDVPVSITALSANMLENRGIENPENLQFFVPGLMLGETVLGTSQVTIRGVGTESIDAGGDPGVPLHIDGHYIQFASYVLQDFFDVERIEVQRGPQGTLYGRNAVGGNINIITKKPTDQFESLFSVDLGNYNKRRIQGVVSGPLTNNLRGRIAISDEKRDGYVENIADGPGNLLNSDYTSLRAFLEFDLTDNIEVLFGGYYYDDDSISFVNRITTEYPEAGFYAALDLPYTNITASDPRKVRQDAPLNASENSKGVSLDVTWDMSSVTLKSLSAYHDAEREIFQDLDGTDFPVWDQLSDNASKSFTQEFQLLSKDESDLKWIAGLFYFKENQDYNFDITGLAGGVGPIFVFGISPVENETKSIAAFGQIDYLFTDRLELSAGLRYTRDKKILARSLFVDLPEFGLRILDLNSNMDDSWEQVSGKVGLNYRVTEDILYYASYSLGFKAGGFNGASPGEPSYKPELLDAYEIGMKGQYLDKRLQLNVSAFYYDYTDKAETKIDLVPGTSISTSIFTNAAAATVAGVELELRALLTDSLSVDASIAYQSSEYDEFSSLDPSHVELGVQDLSGNQLTRSPEWKYHVGAQYEWQLRGDLGVVVARVDYSWVDEQYFRAFNLDSDKAESYHRTNARLQWKSSEDRWLTELYVLNLEDDDVLSNQLLGSPDTGFIHMGSYLPPRTYGLKVSYSF